MYWTIPRSFQACNTMATLTSPGNMATWKCLQRDLLHTLPILSSFGGDSFLCESHLFGGPQGGDSLGVSLIGIQNTGHQVSTNLPLVDSGLWSWWFWEKIARNVSRKLLCLLGEKLDVPLLMTRGYENDVSMLKPFWMSCLIPSVVKWPREKKHTVKDQVNQNCCLSNGFLVFLFVDSWAPSSLLVVFYLHKIMQQVAVLGG